MKHSRFTLALCALWLCASLAPVQARTVRLFAIGNSFSQNVLTYLPQLAREGGHELKVGHAYSGGFSLRQHWAGIEADLANPNDPAGKLYQSKKKSLREMLSEGTWDVVTIQQASINSFEAESYQPYAQKLYAFIKKLQPQAEVVVHQTWAYRWDHSLYNSTRPGRPKIEREMWEQARTAARQTATTLGLRVIPTGDAFWKITSDPQWAYKKDTTFDYKNAIEPALPNQNTSIHTGWRWKNKEFGLDAVHANPVGCYLGGLVWYGFLFNESYEKLTFVPPEVIAASPDYAARLRQVAWQVVRDGAQEDQAALSKSARAVTTP
jgi:hypothetical protein